MNINDASREQAMETGQLLKEQGKLLLKKDWKEALRTDSSLLSALEIECLFGSWGAFQNACGLKTRHAQRPRPTQPVDKAKFVAMVEGRDLKPVKAKNRAYYKQASPR